MSEQPRTLEVGDVVIWDATAGTIARVESIRGDLAKVAHRLGFRRIVRLIRPVSVVLAKEPTHRARWNYKVGR